MTKIALSGVAYKTDFTLEANGTINFVFSSDTSKNVSASTDSDGHFNVNLGSANGSGYEPDKVIGNQIITLSE
jgi:hypothetical protein